MPNLGDELRQPRVAEQQPASGRDAVGFVLKLVWLQLAEIPKAERRGKTSGDVVAETRKRIKRRPKVLTLES